MRLRVQENREILADRGESARDHFIGRGPDDDMVPILHRQTEQLIPDCAAHHVCLHGGKP
jgi:hypothetical protein